ncbi:hypothetical protein B0T11DRAFT_277318 [Plectosphaerella cucumerina]|uniref:Zn(2)-C6 fungal-type domain-containing protein n=1 Tax=Plectosphaerella cucumerina TaxID=40658 RepID=A0A8K0TPX6_9PEZI|nr:hypothetical protein B0T11DRAFT_277318 [Plectosphaerella cucumerina]
MFFPPHKPNSPVASPMMSSNSADTHRRDPACAACSKSKRRCSKQHPVCRRCRHQSLQCVYPFSRRPATFRASHATQSPPLSASETQSSSGLSAHRNKPSDSHIEALSTTHTTVDQSEPPWFLDPSSWTIDHVQIGEDERITYPDSGLDNFIDRMRAWLDQWTSENHCAFVHPRLYGADLPKSLQNAFATWHFYRSASNQTSRRIALRMSADGALDLTQEAAVSDSLLGPGEMPDLRDQIGRTQALLIFQVIGLFDGDVRARGSSESLLSTVTQWADALLRTAAAAVASDQLLVPEEPLNSSQINKLHSDGTVASQWKAWILSESIRRLWIAATLTESAFLIWHHGSAVCPGSIGFTGRSGLWDASSPRSWMERLQESSTAKHPVFCRGLDRLLDEARPSAVDDFTRALLAYGRGLEAVEDWVASEVAE